MKNYQIYYFSGTGNTWWLAHALKDELENNHASVCQSIEGAGCDPSRQITSDTHLILGFPVYGSMPPYPMVNFIDNLPEGTGQSVSLFATQAFASGDTLHWIAQKLRQKGYIPKATRYFKMMNNIHLPAFRFYPPKNGAEMVKSLDSTKSGLRKFATDIREEAVVMKGNNPLGHLVGSIQRNFIHKMISSAGRTLFVEEERCIGCRLCVNHCPTNNISVQNDRYTFGTDCALCMRCYSQCPKDAISFGQKNTDTIKYPRYKGPTGFHPQKLK